MKKTISRVLIVAFMAVTGALNAQKIGYLDLDSLVSLMPEYKTYKEKSDAKLKQLEGFIIALETEFKTKYDEFMEKGQSMGETEQRSKEAELRSLNERVQNSRAEAQNEMQSYNNKILKPIVDKAKKAIELVAKANGYKYIFDSTIGNILYSEPSDNVLTLVKKQLDTMPLVKFPDDGGTQQGGGMNKPNNTGGGTTKPNPGGGTTKPKTGGK